MSSVFSIHARVLVIGLIAIVLVALSLRLFSGLMQHPSSQLTKQASIFERESTKEVLRVPEYNRESFPALPSGIQPSIATEANVRATYGKLPLSFEVNKGQTDRRVKFLSRGSGYSLSLTSNEAVLAFSRHLHKLRKKSSAEQTAIPQKMNRTQKAAELKAENSLRDVVRLRLVGANPTAKVKGTDDLPGKSNYFIGNDPAKWHTGISTYARVKYESIYPGVDTIYYGNQGQLEYDLVVAPHANYRQIRLQYKGANRIRIDKTSGDLILTTRIGSELRQDKPFIYQEIAGARRRVDGSYQLKPKCEIAFRIARYDASQPLIIDPVLDFSTYLGGNAADESYAIAVDQSGNAYISGLTYSANFPVLNPLQDHANRYPSAFITKLDAAGSALLYSTYVGGSTGFNASYGIAVDSAGLAYVTGLTQSTDFPTVNPIQSSLRGDTDGFVLKLNAAGNALVYSTFLGGSGGEYGLGIAVDLSGNAYVIGHTGSTDFPTANAFQNVNNGGLDAFVTKLNATGTGFIYSTYLGGTDREEGYGIAVDTSGNAYVTGGTLSTDFPTVNSLQTYIPPYSDSFIAKLDAAGSALIYSTYLGGSRSDITNAIAVDSAGSAYVAGRTGSTDFPLMNPLQVNLGGSSDAFVSKLNSTGTLLEYSTYLGGDGDDWAYGIAVDSAGSAYVAGYTSSINFPVASPLQATFGGGLSDAFISKLKASGGALLYSTYLGSNQQYDYAFAIAVNSTSAYVTGVTDSNTFPTANPMQPASGGGRDVFISRITDINSTMGTIVVTTNTDNASFNLTGPTPFSGSGRTTTFASVPPGEYRITYRRTDCLAGAPASESKTITAGETINFHGDYEIGFLDFPLSEQSPCTANINTVFDHSQQGPYSDNGEVVAYTGEGGKCNVTNSYQGVRSNVNGTSHYGFRSSLGTPFRINDHYTAGGSVCDDVLCSSAAKSTNLACNVFLFYDGHPGIDYRAGCGANLYTAVYAAVSGTVHYPSSIPGVKKGSDFHILEIDPDAPNSNYRIYYLHLATYPTVKKSNLSTCEDPAIVTEGQHVDAGTLIGRVGKAGTKAAHLHFEVQLNGIPIDPYGWKGDYNDPYTRGTNRNLWKIR